MENNTERRQERVYEAYGLSKGFVQRFDLVDQNSIKLRQRVIDLLFAGEIYLVEKILRCGDENISGDIQGVDFESFSDSFKKRYEISSLKTRERVKNAIRMNDISTAYRILKFKTE